MHAERGCHRHAGRNAHDRPYAVKALLASRQTAHDTTRKTIVRQYHLIIFKELPYQNIIVIINHIHSLLEMLQA